MPKRAVAASGAEPLRSAAVAPLVGRGLQATAAQVQKMHQAIAGRTFGTLLMIPGLSVPTRIAQGVHDLIAQTVYTSIRHGSAGLTTLAGAADFPLTARGSDGAGGRIARNVLNGVFGDLLEEQGSPLAIDIGLHSGGAPLRLDTEGVAGLSRRVCVFAHGLGCDEHSWAHPSDAWASSPWAALAGPSGAIDYGKLLTDEIDCSPLYLRYNTGLPIADNAARLGQTLQALLAAAPHVQQVVLVGHSMGGLVARAACEQAARDATPWLNHVEMVICLGAPHQGALLEHLGHLLSTTLARSDVTAPLARLANARSRGIRDLRHGLKRGKNQPHMPTSVALRMVSGTLGDEGGGIVDQWVGSLFGDGLVRQNSALDDGLVGDVLRVELAGVGHMALLNHPRVFAVMREWLAALPPI